MPGHRRPLMLYWVTTEDHDEDWFIVATSVRQATRLHEEVEGYVGGDATAELVCEVPEGAPDAVLGWPSEELLEACGAKMIPGGGTRVVEVAGRVFVEGDIVTNAARGIGALPVN